MILDALWLGCHFEVELRANAGKRKRENLVIKFLAIMEEPNALMILREISEFIWKYFVKNRNEII